ncbi:unnamed protein product [Acanthoscelides obtectus]|uniref:Uncharacterized protein n=1 Tax=Acanthoscelides obtectus TaxID=200917 RepID=A0A9P0PDH5_ACAOB|nr:unnamed protein product [Acanthoscelides obtectus]CAK1678294.1 hypothetical protein AOBTE_LOCUS31806 [Acanthoscelides obtectus]
MKPKLFALNPKATKGDDVIYNSSHDHRVAALEVCDNIISIQRLFGSRIPFSPNTLENTVVSFLMTSWKLPAWLISN